MARASMLFCCFFLSFPSQPLHLILHEDWPPLTLVASFYFYSSRPEVKEQMKGAVASRELKPLQVPDKTRAGGGNIFNHLHVQWKTMCHGHKTQDCAAKTHCCAFVCVKTDDFVPFICFVSAGAQRAPMTAV